MFPLSTTTSAPEGAAPGVPSGAPPTPNPAAATAETLGLSDLAAIRNLLRGGSVIDWHRAFFEDRSDVERFLRANELRLDDDNDLRRLEYLRETAVEYLERHLGFRIPDEVAAGVPAQDLFFIASKKGKRRAHACVVLKVMHVLHHLAGRELLTRLPVSADQIFHLVEDKVLQAVEEMRSAGLPIVEFAWSRKNADSLITKLLAKKESIAAHVYDKLRFRMITSTEPELMIVLRELVRSLVPFNYVIPGQSVNDIVNLRQIIEGSALLQGYLPELMDLSQVAADKKAPVQNEFSGPSYRIINFVADLPVRVDRYLGLAPSDPLVAEKGSIVFVLTEFQIMDARTASENERGENSHDRYKERQLNRVRARLLHGMKETE